MDWQDLMMVLGGAVMKEEIPSTCYIDCICRLQYSSLRKINGVLTLGNVPRSGAFDMPLSNRLCFSINLHMVVRMLWIGTYS